MPRSNHGCPSLPLLNGLFWVLQESNRPIQRRHILDFRPSHSLSRRDDVTFPYWVNGEVRMKTSGGPNVEEFRTIKSGMRVASLARDSVFDNNDGNFAFE